MNTRIRALLSRYQDLLLVLAFGLLYGAAAWLWLGTGRNWTHPTAIWLTVPAAFILLALAGAALPAWRANQHWVRDTLIFSAAAFGLGWTIVLLLHLLLPWRTEPLGCGGLAWEVAWDRFNPARCDGPLPLHTVGPKAWLQLVPATLVVAAGSLLPAALVRAIKLLAQRALRPAT